MRQYIVVAACLLITVNAATQPLTSRQQQLLNSVTTGAGHNGYANIHSVLIAANGHTVYEQYFNGWNKDSLHDTRSSFKSITSLLMGIAIDKGFIKSVDDKVYSYFPEYALTPADSLKKQMTIENLLEMKSGFDCEEFDGTKDCENDMAATNNWVNFSLALPMKDRPGTAWAYNSSAPVIAGAIISRATHMSIMDFAQKYLFTPLNITNYRWTVDPSGNGMTAGSFYILPADMLKIGQLALQNGLWQGKTIVSKKWLQQSTIATIPIPNFSFAGLSNTKAAISQPTYYGYYWYNEKIKAPSFEENVVFASGNGGQYIMIINKLNVVVVFTQGNYNKRIAKQAFDILASYILPAFEK